MDKTSITFFGGAGVVTGANFLLDTNGTKILIDCGMVQGVPDEHERNKDSFKYDPSSIDFLIITHAHIDHIGMVPKLIKGGFKGIIYSTPTTKALSELMLQNAAGIMDSKSRKEGVSPIFSMEHVRKSFSLWQTSPYHKDHVLNEKVSFYFWNAGHILGSAMAEFRIKKGDGSVSRVLFTGDLGNSQTPLLPETEIPPQIDYLVMDSVYGDRNHESQENKNSRFLEVIRKTIKKRGTLLIPAFSLERTQTILYEINNFVEEKKIEQIPVFLDSPLAINLTKIYESVSNLYNDGVKKEIADGDNIFDFPKLKLTAKVEDSKEILNAPNPKIIIAGSGMSTAGRIIHHEKHFLPDRNSTILFMGYQASGTLGREIQAGAKKVMIGDEEVPVNAEVQVIEGYSAHKDSDGLLDFVERVSPSLKKVFVVMGELKSASFLSQRINDYVGVKALCPEEGSEHILF